MEPVLFRLDQERVDDGAGEAAAREPDHGIDPGVPDRVAEGQGEPEAERQEHGRQHALVGAVVRGEQEGLGKDDGEDHRREERGGADGADGAGAPQGRGADRRDTFHALYATGPMRSPREPWKCAHCSTLNLSTARSCRRCGNARGVLLTRDDAGSPGLAAVCSGLLPGLGQLYQGRWIRGAVIFLIPILAVALGGAFIATFDPLTSLVIRHAVVFTVAVIGGLLLYHLWVVADAFAGGLRHGGSLRGKHAADYFALGIVTLALIAGYGSVYRGANAWAGLAAKVFAPVAGATARGVSTSFDLPPWNGRERLNVLVLGIDSRGVAGDTQNTDTMIVLSIDPVNRTAAMLSVPRDTLVPIPGHGSDKVNAAFALGGPDLAQKTIEGLLGIRINSYALINFQAFTEIVDSVGGVIVDVKRPIRDEAYPTADFGVERLNIQPGPQLMPGDIALKYARSRHDSNDFSRAKRQQDVISGIRARLASDGMLGRLPAIVNDVGSAVETNFDPANILPLAGLGGGIPSSDIRSEVLLPCGGDFAALRAERGQLAAGLLPDPGQGEDRESRRRAVLRPASAPGGRAHRGPRHRDEGAPPPRTSPTGFRRGPSACRA